MDNVPVIGVTRCSRLDDYVASIERSGAKPRVLEVSESPRAVLQTIDGILLTGGGDVDPALYGETRHESVEDAEPALEGLDGAHGRSVWCDPAWVKMRLAHQRERSSRLACHAATPSAIGNRSSVNDALRALK